MKLYYSPGACSLADHIALLEAHANFESEAVNIHEKRTASGRDFREINAKGYVPALVLDSGETITENIAVLDWIASQYPALRPKDQLARTRLVEMLAFISTEIHGAFKPLWHGGSEQEKQKASEHIAELLRLAANQLKGEFLFGAHMSVADCYLFVMLRWANKFSVAVPTPLRHMEWLMEARPSVQAALKREGLFAPGQNAPSLKGAVIENAAQHRFERPIHDDMVAAAYYRDAEGKLDFIHTEVPAEFSGYGIATELARGTFEILRESGRKAVLTCPFLVRYANRHPEYADIVV
jgi:glutathione S-transferase